MPDVTNLLAGVPLVESPLFPQLIDDMDLDPSEKQLAIDLNRNGFVAFNFPDPEIFDRIDRIKARLAPRFGVDFDDPAAIKNTGDMRIQDAWKFDDDVKAIAANPQLLSLLSRLYGRRAFPFQTLNFPVGTQQHLHSDIVHFSSQPERFMCGVWLAMEDVTPETGPLCYCPGSHQWPIVNNTMIGRRGWGSTAGSAQSPFEAVWDAMKNAFDVQEQTFIARKGQALIWAANLLHGGSRQIDRTLTRWSQVTHYYFADCLYYTPAFSDEPLGRLDLRTITNIETGLIEPNKLLGEQINRLPPASAEPRQTAPWIRRILGQKTPPLPMLGTAGVITPTLCLPPDFDPLLYLRLNPDVAAAGVDAGTHYLETGHSEGRHYR